MDQRFWRAQHRGPRRRCHVPQIARETCTLYLCCIAFIAADVIYGAVVRTGGGRRLDMRHNGHTNCITLC